MSKKRIIRTVSNQFNANSLEMLSLGGVDRTKNIAQFSLYGMAGGVGYSLLKGKNVLVGLLIGTLGGMFIGTLVENRKNKINNSQTQVQPKTE